MTLLDPYSRDQGDFGRLAAENLCENRRELRAAHTLGPDQLPDLVASVHRAIGQLGQPLEPDEFLTPAVSVRRSVHRDYEVCLDCGYRGKTLRRHISTRHALSEDEYRPRWGLRSNHPLTAPAYSEHRSTATKARGFGRKPGAQVAPAPTPTASTPVKCNGELEIETPTQISPGAEAECRG
jgi:predicted transcriptional regulator